MNDQQQVCS